VEQGGAGRSASLDEAALFAPLEAELRRTAAVRRGRSKSRKRCSRRCRHLPRASSGPLAAAQLPVRGPPHHRGRGAPTTAIFQLAAAPVSIAGRSGAADRGVSPAEPRNPRAVFRPGGRPGRRRLGLARDPVKSDPGSGPANLPSSSYRRRARDDRRGISPFRCNSFTDAPSAAAADYRASPDAIPPRASWTIAGPRGGRRRGGRL